MAKLEEIAELLTEEIQGFNVAIEKLEKLSKQLSNVQEKADSSQIQFVVKEHLRKMEQYDLYNKRELKGIHATITKARVIPKWMIVLFYTVTALLLLSVGYSFYQRHQNQKTENEMKSLKIHFNRFLNEVPEADAHYKAWINKQEPKAK